MLKKRFESLFIHNTNRKVIFGIILPVLILAGTAALSNLNSYPNEEPAQLPTPAAVYLGNGKNTTSGANSNEYLADIAPSLQTLGQASQFQPVELSSSKYMFNGKSITLKLVMTEGRHITNADPGPFGEDYYEGNLTGQVYDGQNKLKAVTDMTPFFSESLVFRNRFDIAFDDYNGDGLPDFTIGQYMGSNFRVYNIFTIKEDGKIAELPVENSPDGIVSSGYEDQGGYYSVKLPRIISNGFKVSLYNMETGSIDPAFYQWSGTAFKRLKKPELSQLDQKLLQLKSGKKIPAGKLIEQLDIESDEILTYLYYSDPGKIKADTVYEGGFTAAGRKELLVIFKLTGLPHVAGLDTALIAIFDEPTLELVSQKGFVSDECQFQLLKDSKGAQYLLFSGTTSYQGHSAGTLQLFDLYDNWTQMSLDRFSVDQAMYRFQLMSGGIISVLSQEYQESGDIKWHKNYYLKWDPATAALLDYIPKTHTDGAGKPYFDRESFSPDGKYAVAAHGWGFDENSYILIYSTAQNKLIRKYDILSSDFEYIWSPDSKKLCVKSLGKTWINTDLLDIEKNGMIDMLSIAGYENLKKLGVKFPYELLENRDDPYIQTVEWSPDSKKALLHYQWTDSRYMRQSGTFVYDTEKKTISKIVQNPGAAEGGNLKPAKPKGFQWHD